MSHQLPVARTVDFKQGERNVFFHLLTACNLSCKHCYINPPQHGTETLPKDTAIKWLKLFARSDLSSNLILLGGEPTMHTELADIIRAAKAMRYTVTVDSNGFLFNDLLNRVTPKELDYLSFSLDGPTPEINDPIRGENVFTVCTHNLSQAVDKGFNTSVIYTVSSLNIDHLHHMPQLLVKLGVKRFFIQVIGLRGKSAGTTHENDTDWQVEPERWLQVIPEVARQAADLGLHVTYPKVFLDPDEKFDCAGQVAENYFIFPNGRVYMCPLCEDYPINSFLIENNELRKREGINEDRFFSLSIPEGCVMNKLLQPNNIEYHPDGAPKHRISCCLLKQEILPNTKQTNNG